MSDYFTPEKSRFSELALMLADKIIVSPEQLQVAEIFLKEASNVDDEIVKELVILLLFKLMPRKNVIELLKEYRGELN